MAALGGYGNQWFDCIGWKEDIDQFCVTAKLPPEGEGMFVPFWGLNAALAFLGALSFRSDAVAAVSLGVVAAVLLGWAATGIANRARYHAVLGANWLEREIGIYASLAFWGAIFVAAVDPTLEREPLFAVVQIAVLGGLAGMFLSLLPITRFLNINR